jgi:hypothetical protein
VEEVETRERVGNQRQNWKPEKELEPEKGWNQRKIVERAKTSCEEESLKSSGCSQPPSRG